MSDVSEDDVAPEHIRELRQRAARTPELEREIAMLRAGVDDSTPVGKMFASAYQGDLDPAKVAAAAQEVGALKVTTPTAPISDTTATTSEQEQTFERTGLSLGAPSGDFTPPPAKPATESSLAAFDAAADRGERPDARAAAYLGDRLGKALAGDKTAVWDKWSEEDLR